MHGTRTACLAAFLGGLLPLGTGVADDPAPTAEASVVGCRVEVAPAPDFASPVAVSSEEATAFTPDVAVRGDAVLLVWQETVQGANRVAWARAENGCIGPVRYVEDELANPRRPSVAATASGWVLAYEARDVPDPLIRAVDLDAAATPLGPPETISEPGRVASRVQVEARGDDVVFAWTDAGAHWVARRGSIEELPPTRLASDLEAPGLVNVPSILLDGGGRLYLAYRDGGPERTDYEIQLLVREVGHPFGKPTNVSHSSGLMSDGVTMTAEEDGSVRLVWVEQADERPDAFEVVHATLSPDLEMTEPARFATLGLPSFEPSVTRGLATVWHAGSVRSGLLYFAPGPVAPRRILPGLTAGMTKLATDAAGNLHLAFVESADPPRLRYAWSRIAD